MVDEELRKEILEGFRIRRVPPKTEKRFKELSFEEFEGDYGMLLKHLVDFYDGLIPKGWEHLELAIENMDERLVQLEKLTATKDEEKPVRKEMMDGSKR